MIYLLIVVSLGMHNKGSTSFYEFPTMESCEFAAKEIKEMSIFNVKTKCLGVIR